MLLEITDGSVSRGGRTVLSHFDFMVRGTEKIAVTGRNGAGKTTLLQLLAGELELDGNEKNPSSGMKTARRLSAAMLHQNAFPDQSVTVAEICRGEARSADRSAGAVSSDVEFDRLLTGFGFRKEDKERQISTFSGGEQEKLAMIRLFLQEPDLLLLDEPTNHLDMETCEWLESWLRGYPRAVVIVSHDRFFLDRTADVVCEVQDGRLTRYAGNYTRYREEKQARIRRQMKEWERQQAEIRRLQELIVRFRNRPNKAAFARSRKKILERMTPVQKPEEDTARIRTGPLLPLRRSARWVFEAEDLCIGYPGGFTRTVDLRIRRGRKIAFLGPNGSGKTTLLRTLAGLLPPVSGRLSTGANTDLAYFDQRSASLQSDGDVLSWFRARFPSLTEQQAHTTLAGYLFGGKDARRPVNNLSGGEKARLVLAALLEERPNVLLLDEPTNHMDLPARETMESVLAAYQGTLLFVSHDRYFIRQIAEELLLFDEGEIRYFPFGYERYLDWKKEREETGAGASAEDLRKARTLKDQAMIESFQAVPGKSHLPGALSTRELARDWRLRELEKEMRAAEEAFRTAEEEKARLRERLREEQLKDLFTGEFPKKEQDLHPAEEDRAYENARLRAERWTEACLSWYEEWEEGQS